MERECFFLIRSLQIVISFLWLLIHIRRSPCERSTQHPKVSAIKCRPLRCILYNNVDNVLQLIYDCMQLWLFITWQMNKKIQRTRNKNANDAKNHIICTQNLFGATNQSPLNLEFWLCCCYCLHQCTCECIGHFRHFHKHAPKIKTMRGP